MVKQMSFQIGPSTLNAIHVAAAAIPAASATALVGSGGSTWIALALFASSILSATAQTFHFSGAANNLIKNLPQIVMALQMAMNDNKTPSEEVKDK